MKAKPATAEDDDFNKLDIEHMPDDMRFVLAIYTYTKQNR